LIDYINSSVDFHRNPTVRKYSTCITAYRTYQMKKYGQHQNQKICQSMRQMATEIRKDVKSKDISVLTELSQSKELIFP
jgi:maltooligosyltrehalose synthase